MSCIFKPPTRPMRYGQRNFAVSDPDTWNSLPRTIRHRSLNCCMRTSATNSKPDYSPQHNTVSILIADVMVKHNRTRMQICTILVYCTVL